MKLYSREIDDILLIVTADRRAYELQATPNSDYISITPDEGDPEPSQIERNEFLHLWKNTKFKNK